MKVSLGTVVGGQIVLDDGPFSEGTRVVVITHDSVDNDPLSPEERAELLAGIVEADWGETISGDDLFERLRNHESLNEDVEEAWKKEIQRRIDTLEKGECTLLDVDDVLAEAKSAAPE